MRQKLYCHFHFCDKAIVRVAEINLDYYSIVSLRLPPSGGPDKVCPPGGGDGEKFPSKSLRLCGLECAVLDEEPFDALVELPHRGQLFAVPFLRVFRPRRVEVVGVERYLFPGRQVEVQHVFRGEVICRLEPEHEAVFLILAHQFPQGVALAEVHRFLVAGVALRGDIRVLRLEGCAPQVSQGDALLDESVEKEFRLAGSDAAECAAVIPERLYELGVLFQCGLFGIFKFIHCETN